MKTTINDILAWMNKLKELHGGDTLVRIAPTTDTVDHRLKHDIAGVSIQTVTGESVDIVLMPHLEPVGA